MLVSELKPNTSIHALMTMLKKWIATLPFAQEAKVYQHLRNMQKVMQMNLIVLHSQF